MSCSILLGMILPTSKSKQLVVSTQNFCTERLFKCRGNKNHGTVRELSLQGTTNFSFSLGWKTGPGSKMFKKQFASPAFHSQAKHSIPPPMQRSCKGTISGASNLQDFRIKRWKSMRAPYEFTFDPFRVVHTANRRAISIIFPCSCMSNKQDLPNGVLCFGQLLAWAVSKKAFSVQAFVCQPSLCENCPSSFVQVFSLRTNLCTFTCAT